jgi:hypothetical protein
VRVVEVVAAEQLADPHELAPLYSAIDPDALDALFDPRTDSGGEVARVKFTYEGHTVTVTSDGRIELSSAGV